MTVRAFRIAVVALCATLFFQGSIQAVSGTPSIFRITIKMIEASTDGGTTFTTVGEGDLSLDIASSSAGGAVAGYATKSDMPPGTYNAMRITMSNQIGLKGSIEQDTGGNAGTTFYTTADCAGSSTAGDEVECTFTVTSAPSGFSLDTDAGTMTTTDTSVSIVIKKDAATRVKVDFDVTNAFQIVGDDSFAPNDPTVTVTSS